MFAQISHFTVRRRLRCRFCLQMETNLQTSLRFDAILGDSLKPLTGSEIGLIPASNDFVLFLQ